MKNGKWKLIFHFSFDDIKWKIKITVCTRTRMPYHYCWHWRIAERSNFNFGPPRTTAIDTRPGRVQSQKRVPRFCAKYSQVFGIIASCQSIDDSTLQLCFSATRGLQSWNCGEKKFFYVFRYLYCDFSWVIDWKRSNPCTLYSCWASSKRNFWTSNA